MTETSDDHDTLVRLAMRAEANRAAIDAHYAEINADYCKLSERVSTLERQADVIESEVEHIEDDIETLRTELKTKLSASTLGIWITITSLICATLSFAVSSIIG